MEKPRYKISEQLQADSRFVLFRAKTVENGHGVILKVPRNPYPSQVALNKLKSEYTLLTRSSHPNILAAQQIEPFENSIALVLEDVEGAPLSQQFQHTPCTLDRFLSVAITLTDSIRYLHGNRIIHKNINPGNILLKPDNGVLKLTGFGLATELSREAIQPDAREIADTDLGYISPEQTGRMNRVVDHRTDFYSLGAVFYRMLTQRPPFASHDPMEMIHSHLARTPQPAHEVRSDIPLMLSRIIQQLLAKNAEDRYQSANGLLHDLNLCRQYLAEQGQIENFDIRTKDVSDQFRISDKLYGRKNELEDLRKTFEEAQQGNSGVVLVSGYSGVGKSRLISELKKSVGQSRGYFVSGKFDQFRRDIPLSSLLTAFRNLMRQILSESDEEIDSWRKAVLDAVGTNGSILNDVIPEMENLIGPQPAVAELPPVETNNRFNHVFSSFVQVFTQAEHPLCLFLDDLQWIDSATRQWIESHLIRGDFSHFLLIGAYRDNEVSASHPLMLMLDRLHQSHIPIKTIQLQPLDQETLGQMIADTLMQRPEQCTDLTALVYQKTNGNPFFSRQCLHSLNDSGAIYFDEGEHTWKYHLAQAKQAGISDNVVDLMSSQIDRQPEAVQTLLQTAACIGNEFDLGLLERVSGYGRDEVVQLIEAAKQAGLIVPVYSWNRDEEDDYRFLHDRVQQAALAQVEEEKRKSTRYQIGRLLLESAYISEAEDKIYDIADHLNYASSLIRDPVEINQLIHINLAASIRAKNATAYDKSLQFVRQAMDYVPAPAWDTHSELTRDLYLQRAEAEHLTGNHTEAEPYYDLAIEHAESVIDKARVYQRKIHYYSNQRKFKQAYQTGREAVRKLGVRLPPSFIPPLLIKEFIEYTFRVRGKKIADIVHQKEMTDEKLKMAILLMATFARAAYQMRPELCVLVAAKMVNVCLKHGNTDGGFIGYLAFGPIFQGAILNRKQTGFDFGQLTLALVERFNSLSYKSETHFVVGYFAMPWRRPAVEMEQYWQIAYEAGLETGDLFHTSCACCGTIQSYFMRGMPFDEIQKAADRYIEFLTRIENTEAIGTIRSVLQAIRNLKGETTHPDSFDSSDFNEAAFLDQLSHSTSRHFAHYYYINKAFIHYLWGSYDQAFTMINISSQYLKDSPGMLHTAEHYFLKGLILCALYPNATKTQQFRWNRTISSLLSRFKKYAAGCPSNFIHKCQLLEAEYLRVTNHISQAEQAYNAAIQSAMTHGYAHITALANLRLASFHESSGRHRLTLFHLRDAQYGFGLWGATAMIEALQRKYPELSTQEESHLAAKAVGGNDGAALRVKRTGSIDLASVLKSAEAISREIRLHDLITSMLKIIVENAGAERIVLFLNKSDRLVAEAEYEVKDDDIRFLPQILLAQYTGAPRSVIQLVTHSLQPVILQDASHESDFMSDPYFQSEKTRSVLCAPLVQQGKLIAIVYLENNLATGAFTQERIEVLTLLSSQMAISIENALHYETLEEKVIERTRELNEEKNKSDSLLLNILPAETADELKRTGTAKAKNFARVTVLFTDFKNFTSYSSAMSAYELVSEIHHCYSVFDQIIQKYNVEKIKTIGDSYMCVGGLPVENTTNPVDTVRAAMEIRAFMLEEKRKREAEGKTYFEVRIGLHTGPVVAGIVGLKKFAYDIWGDTVNIASRMESSSETGMINISGDTYDLIKDQFHCTYRGKLEARNRGLIDMYFVDSVKK
jgi:predicted ATPase/class 3 adenylate cyclase